MTDDVHELLRLAMREVTVLSIMVAAERAAHQHTLDSEKFFVELLREMGEVLGRWGGAPAEVVTQGQKARAYAEVWTEGLAEIPQGLSEAEYKARCRVFDALNTQASVSLRLRALIALREDRVEDAQAIVQPSRLRLA